MSRDCENYEFVHCNGFSPWLVGTLEYDLFPNIFSCFIALVASFTSDDYAVSFTSSTSSMFTPSCNIQITTIIQQCRRRFQGPPPEDKGSLGVIYNTLAAFNTMVLNG